MKKGRVWLDWQKSKTLENIVVKIMFSMLQSSDSYKQAIKEDILDLYDNLNSDQIDQHLKNK